MHGAEGSASTRPLRIWPAIIFATGLWVTRLVPGVIGNPRSVETESFQDRVLEGPQYTRPAVFRGHEVPEVLRSGDHAAIARWRRARALELTQRRRPDLVTAQGERTR